MLTLTIFKLLLHHRIVDVCHHLHLLQPSAHTSHPVILLPLLAPLHLAILLTHYHLILQPHQLHPLQANRFQFLPPVLLQERAGFLESLIGQLSKFGWV